MCRTLLTIVKNPRDKGQQEIAAHLLGNEMMNAVDKGNTHGFFIESYGAKEDIRARTFSLHTWMENLLHATEHGARLIHTHARKVSRGGLSQHGIHGWTHQGWSCTHNGTIYLHSELENDAIDSINVFKAIFHKEGMTLEEILAAIKDLFENKMWIGTGTFTLTNDDHTIVVSVNRDTQFDTVNGSVLNIVSNSDVVDDFKDFVYIPLRKKVSTTIHGKMKFQGRVQRRSIRYEFPAPAALSTATAISHNEIVLVDNNSLEIIDVQDIVPGPSFMNFHEYEEPGQTV